MIGLSWVVSPTNGRWFNLANAVTLDVVHDDVWRILVNWCYTDESGTQAYDVLAAFESKAECESFIDFLLVRR